MNNTNQILERLYGIDSLDEQLTLLYMWIKQGIVSKNQFLEIIKQLNKK